MNPEEKARILNLVKEGILTTEEATILLENHIKPKSETEDEEVLKAFYEELANQANQNASQRDQKYAIQKDLEKELVEKLAAKRDLSALNTAEVISPENEIKLNRLNEEIEQLNGQLEQIKAEIAELDRVLKRDSKQQKTYQETDKENYTEATSGFDSEEFKRRVSDTAQTVSKTLSGMFTVNKTKHGIPIPSLVSKQYDKEFIYTQAKASIFNVKITKGNIKFNVWDRDDLVIAVNGKIYGSFEEPTTLEAFHNRANIEVNNDEVTFQVNNRLTTSNIEIFAPRQTFDYIQLHSLSGDVSIKNIDSNDIFVETIDGDINLDKVKASMIELDTKNGNVFMTNIEAKDVSARTLNGHHRLTGVIKNTVLSSLNGSIRVTYLDTDLVKATLDSKNGDIKVNMPKETALHGRAQTAKGNIQFRHNSLEVYDIKKEQFMQVKEFHYHNENEPFELNATTLAGNIRIKADAEIINVSD